MHSGFIEEKEGETTEKNRGLFWLERAAIFDKLVDIADGVVFAT